MPTRQPHAFSIAVADTSAIGHINVGLNLYRQFAALPSEVRVPGQQLDFNRTVELVVPAVTNLALGLELLLKVHHFQLTGLYPRGHDVKALGSSFPEPTLHILRANYSEMYNDPNVSKGLEFRLSGGTLPVSTEWSSPATSTYDEAINYIGRIYEKWRYIYEEFLEQIDVAVVFTPLYFTAMAVHKAIRAHTGGTKIILSDGQSGA